MHPRSILAASAAAVLAAAAPARAQQGGAGPLVTDRPDFTESAVTVPAGRLQVEGGYTLDRTGDDRRHTLGELLLRWGMLGAVEFRVAPGSRVWSRGPSGEAAGFSDAAVGAKLAVTAPDAAPRGLRPAIAVILMADLPTGSDAFTAEAIEPEATLALGWDLSDRLALGANLNYARPNADERRFDQASASAALGIGLSPRLGSYLEVYGFSTEAPDGSGTAYVNGGLTLLLTPDAQLDVRIGRGLNASNDNHFVGIGLAVRWPSRVVPGAGSE